MEWNKESLKPFKEQLNYSDQEMELFLENPRNHHMLTKGMELLGKSFVFEVVKSKGCFAGHIQGQEVVLDGLGCLVQGKGPEKVCLYLLQALSGLVFAAQEFIYAGLDPNNMTFKTAGCFDVGLQCGGLGHVAVKMRVEDNS